MSLTTLPKKAVLLPARAAWLPVSLAGAAVRKLAHGAERVSRLVESAGHELAADEARERAERERQEIRGRAAQRKQQVRKQAKAAEDAIDARVDTARAEFQDELGQAAGELRESRDARERAETLDELADEEQQARRTG